jgi:hypothetical protein
MRKPVAVASCAAAVLIALGGCSHSHSSASSSASAAASKIAANPTVKAASGKAEAIVKGCISAQGASPTLRATRACLETRVPKPARKALAQCVGAAYAHDVQATGHLKAAWATLKTSDVAGSGAQPCVAVALR